MALLIRPLQAAWDQIRAMFRLVLNTVAWAFRSGTTTSEPSSTPPLGTQKTTTKKRIKKIPLEGTVKCWRRPGGTVPWEPREVLWLDDCFDVEMMDINTAAPSPRRRRPRIRSVLDLGEL